MEEEIKIVQWIKLTVPDNWHCHWRQGLLLVWMVKMLIESGFRGRVLGMPNTNPPILTGEQALAYGDEVYRALAPYPEHLRFTPVLTIQITENTTPEMIRMAWTCGIRVAKVYPRYVTTNSENGVMDYEKIMPALEEAAYWGMIVCFHGEHPAYDVQGIHKEEAFIAILERIRLRLPSLKIVVEHVTTRKMVEWVKREPMGYTRATITAHHLVLTLDDVIGYSKRSGGLMRVHHGCKPQPKFLDDLLALQDAAVSGDPHFMYGGDDAAHLKSKKECDGSACGIFPTTVAIPTLIELFSKRNALSNIDAFLSGHGREFYGYPGTAETIAFEDTSWVVPAEYPVSGTDEGVVPFLAGETMRRKIVS